MPDTPVPTAPPDPPVTAALCECSDYDPVCACRSCGMPIDHCQAKHDQLGNWYCLKCVHSATLGVPHAVPLTPALL